MGNRTLVLSFFFTVLVFVQGAWADPCYDAMGNPTGADCSFSQLSGQGGNSFNTGTSNTGNSGAQIVTPGGRRPTTSGGSSSSTGTVSCDDVLAITYCIRNNITKMKCVRANSVQEALAQCPGASSAWDLRNRDYGFNYSQNIWMCSGQGSKYKICTNPENVAKHNLKWEGSTNGEGICYQNDKGVKDACGFNDLAHQTNSNCDEVDGMVPDGKGSCMCDSSKNFVDSGKNACVCKDDYEKKAGVCEKKTDTARKTPTTPAPEGVSPEMARCVTEWKEKASKCESSGGEAKKRCDQSNTDNKEVKEAAAIPSQIAGQFVNAKSGSGMVSECIRAGAIAGTSKIAMDQMATSCESEYKTCTKTCYADGIQAQTAMYNECSKFFGAPDETGEGNANQKHYMSNEGAIVKTFADGAKTCHQDAAQNKGILNDVLNGLASALLAGQQCACQLTTANTSTCTHLPTSEECAANPALAGCPAVTAIDICTSGSPNYSALGCKCQTNNTLEGCAGFVAANPGLNGFAGSDVSTSKGGSTAGIGSPSSGGAGIGGLGDLSGQKTPDAALAAKPTGGVPSFGGGSGGGGGGGGGSAPGGGGEPAAAAHDGDEKTGLGGIFGQAKSMVGSLLGGGGSNKPGGALGGKNAPDMNRFKPNGFRGVASDTFGGKNMEIWHMINERYDYNDSTFLTSP